MKFSLFTNYGALNSAPVFSAFEQSLTKWGVSVVHNDASADVAVIWSVLWKGRMLPNKQIWDLFRKNNKPVVVLEVGCFERGTTWKVGLNGINKNNFFLPENLDANRPNKLKINLKSWNKQGEFILICAQQQESQQWIGQPSTVEWVSNTIETIQKFSNRPILLRPHPREKLPAIETKYKNVYRQEPSKLKNSYDNFDLNFNNVYATINWNSNPGIQSVINGIPAFVSNNSLAADVGNLDYSSINAPVYPNRDKWLIEISHTEYTLEEIAAGLPLLNLTKKLSYVNFNL